MDIKLHKLAFIIALNNGLDLLLLDIFSHSGKISFKNSSGDNSPENLPKFSTFNCPFFWANRNNLIVHAKKI